MKTTVNEDLPNWKSIAEGGVILTPTSPTAIDLRVMIRNPSRLGIEMVCLGSGRQELTAPCGQPIGRYRLTTEMGGSNQPTTEFERRIETASVGVGALYTSRATIPVDQSLISRISYFGISIETMEKDPKYFYVERPVHRFIGSQAKRDSHYALLVSDDEANRRIEMIAERSDLITPADPHCADGLTKLFVSIKGGYDTPLLMRTLEEDFDG